MKGILRGSILEGAAARCCWAAGHERGAGMICLMLSGVVQLTKDEMNSVLGGVVPWSPHQGGADMICSIPTGWYSPSRMREQHAGQEEASGYEGSVVMVFRGLRLYGSRGMGKERAERCKALEPS